MRFISSQCVRQLTTMLTVLLGGITSTYATVTSGMGTFTLDGGSQVTGTTASGSYTAANGGGTGRFTITLNSSKYQGYNGNPTFFGGSNGLMIQNPSTGATSQDKFSYTLSLTPNDASVTNTVKIAQTSYASNPSSGNSEVARQTLSYTNDTATGGTARAYVAQNPSVPMFYNAMGDYFMGQFVRYWYYDGVDYYYQYTSNVPQNTEQLRTDSKSALYFYQLPLLSDYNNANTGTTNNTLYIRTNAYTDQVFWDNTASHTGALPSGMYRNDLLKSTSTNPNNQSTYAALSTGSTIANGGSYVSYGVANTDSQYIINVENPKTVTLDYQGIMNGSAQAITTASYTPVGETYAEWITFGIESTSPPNVIPAPPNANPVTCPAGMIADNLAATDYDNLGSNVTATNQTIIGNVNESYLLGYNVLSNASMTSGGKDIYHRFTSGGSPVFEFWQDFSSKNVTRTISYNFYNKFDSNQKQPIDKFSLSIFDIDSNYLSASSAYQYIDKATVTGYDINGNPVIPTRTYSASTITTTPPYRQTDYTVQCNNDVLDGKCQVSLTFNTPIVRLDITYGNYDNGQLLTDTGQQAINIKFDGYCYTPQPRLSLTKVLADNRIADTDQFTVQIKNGTTVVNDATNSTTTGTTNVVTTGTGTTGTYKIDPTKTYVLTEAASGTTDLSKYQATYDCKKKSDGTTITTLDPNSVKMTYGDNWVCTVSNAQKKYTFSGIVFNDNGGLTLTEQQRTGINAQYFNGKYEPAMGETGVYQTGLKIQLARNCPTTANPTATPVAIKTVDVTSSGTDIGKYSITATPTEMAGATNVCLIEQEPGGNFTTYSVDTTNNQLNPNYVATTYNYPNLNFGEVSQNNAGLALVKEQATNDCNITNTAMLGLTYNALTQSGIDARKCVAYKITAYNRTNLTNPLTNVQITDPLPKKGVNTSTVTSTLVAPTDNTDANFNINFSSGVTGAVTDLGQAGTVVSNVKSLAAGASMSLYFNTKYDSSLP